MLKKVAITLCIICGVCLVGAAICIPFGIKDSIREVSEMMESYTIDSKTIDVDPSVKTIAFYKNYFGDIQVEQSTDNTAHLVLYDNDIVEYTVNYEEDNKAVIRQKRTFGNRSFDEDKIKRSIVKEIQNYPDAVLYIPSTINIETDSPYLFEDGLEFANREDLFKADNDVDDVEETSEIYDEY